jgi:isovaleryl-CoA dehydrogenase
MFELMQGKIADMYATWNACRSYAYTVAKAADGGSNIRKDAAAVILFAAEKATWMALEAIQCLGGNGYINDFPTGRLLRDAKLYEIGAGTSEIRRMLIGRELFQNVITRWKRTSSTAPRSGRQEPTGAATPILQPFHLPPQRDER